MTNPSIRFWIFLAISCVYALILVFRFVAFGAFHWGEATIWFLLVFLPLAWSGEAFQEYHGIRRLNADVNVIARWIVNQHEWDSFIAFDTARSADQSNAVWIRPVGRGESIEIIFGSDEVLVDGRRYKLHRGTIFHVAWIDVRPACLEIAILGGADALSFGVLRVPVPEAALTAGRRVFDHYKGLIPGTAEPPKVLFGYDRAEGAAERYRPRFDRKRSAAARAVLSLVLNGLAIALVGIGIAAVARYLGSDGAMDPGAAQLLIIVGVVTAVGAVAVTAFLCAKARQTR